MEAREFDRLVCQLGKRIDGRLSDIKRTSYSFLRAIDGKDDVTMTQLAEELGISLPRCSTLVKQMERKRLIKRSCPKWDKRISFIHITDAGKKALEEGRKRFLGFYTKIEAYFGDDFPVFCSMIEKTNGFLDSLQEE